MYRLAKVGFSQSYTYFTWRETKREMEQYLTELAEPGPRDYLPPAFLRQHARHQPGLPAGGAKRSAYLIRAALGGYAVRDSGVSITASSCAKARRSPAARSTWTARNTRSGVWDWDRPGNIVPEITALNRIRRTPTRPCGRT